MEYFLYILKSNKDNGYYVGITGNLNNRLNYHNKGRVKSTKSRIPFEIIYTETFSSILEARNREKYLKSYKGSKEKLDIIDKATF
ncbi:MAG: GIY-YIG nuclease family protein [Bacteroidetes bacterium]|nr:GIY-YIG nuclease family protein [Bacteroidota bacterium]